MTELNNVIPMEGTMDAMEEVVKADIHPAVKVVAGVAVVAVTAYAGYKVYKARKNKKAKTDYVAPTESVEDITRAEENVQ